MTTNHERILAFNCVYCKQICFFVKNFKLKLTAVVNDFSAELDPHICQFMWQEFYDFLPYKQLRQADFTSAKLADEFQFTAAARGVIDSSKLLVYRFNLNSTAEHSFIYDNGTQADIKAVKPGLNISAGQLLKFNSTGLKLTRINEFKPINLLNSNLSQKITLPVITLDLIANEQWQLEMQLLRLQRQMAEFNHQPVQVLAFKPDKRSGMFRRIIKILEFESSRSWLERLVLPQGFKLKLNQETVELRYIHAFD